MSGDRVILQHILDAINAIERYAAVGYEEYIAHSQWSDSIIRQCMVIGEATKRLTNDSRANAPEIEWSSVAGLRDVLIHRYSEVDEDELWKIVERDLPTLKQAVIRLIAALGG